MTQRRFIGALIVAVVILVWILPMRSSLWLDETGTFWLVKAHVSDVVSRSFFWMGESPLYYLTAWAAIHTGGMREVILRLPSLLAMAISTWILSRVGTRLFGAETGLLAALVFAGLQETSFAAADARPYALALMFLNAQMLMLLRWLDRYRIRDLAWCAVFAALAVYSHPLFSLGLIVPMAFGVWRSSRKLEIAFALVAIATLCIPLGVQMLGFYTHRASHTIAGTPLLTQLLESLAPPVIVASILAALVLAYTKGMNLTASWIASKEHTVLLICWMVSAPMILFALAVFTDVKLFVPRYYLSAAPGLALLSGCVIRSLESANVRRIIAAAVALGAIASFGIFSKFQHGREDWRGAMAMVRSIAGTSEMPVLVVSGFAEGTDPRQFADSALKDALFAPTVAYPAAGKIVRLPIRFNEEYMQRVASDELTHVNEFLLVDFQNSPVEMWLRGRFSNRNPKIDHPGNFWKVDVVRFTLAPNH